MKSTNLTHLNLAAQISAITDKTGTHVKVFFKEYDEQEDKVGADIGLVTYHTSTHSITIGKKIKEGYTADKLALEFVEFLKNASVAEEVKKLSGLEKISTRPVWCKQLNKHFR